MGPCLKSYKCYLKRITFMGYIHILAYVAYFKVIKVGLWDRIAVYVTVYPPVVARQRLSKHVLAATKTRNNRRFIGSVVYCAVHVIWKESRRLVLPRTSCYVSILGTRAMILVIHIHLRTAYWNYKNWHKESSVEDVGWVYLSQDRDRWRTVQWDVEFYKGRKLLDIWATVLQEDSAFIELVWWALDIMLFSSCFCVVAEYVSLSRMDINSRYLYESRKYLHLRCVKFEGSKRMCRRRIKRVV
jgi:hypothetical protein